MVQIQASIGKHNSWVVDWDLVLIKWDLFSHTYRHCSRSRQTVGSSYLQILGNGSTYKKHRVVVHFKYTSNILTHIESRHIQNKYSWVVQSSKGSWEMVLYWDSVLQKEFQFSHIHESCWSGFPVEAFCSKRKEPKEK